jgi:hypothetical protein
MPSPQATAGVVHPARISNHPALARTNATPPYLRRGVLLELMSLCTAIVLQQSIQGARTEI